MQFSELQFLHISIIVVPRITIHCSKKKKESILSINWVIKNIRLLCWVQQKNWWRVQNVGNIDSVNIISNC